MNPANPPRILVLASASPRRDQLLRQAGYRPVIRPSDIAEVRGRGENPQAYVERLAREKARAARLNPDELVLAADTTVVVDANAGGEPRVLEKPSSDAEAMEMLRLLSGRMHEVLTGVALRYDDVLESRVEASRVHFCRLSESEIEEYVLSGEPQGKAGGYAIQGLGSRFVTRVEGCYANVVGLPVALVYQLLRSLPFAIKA